ncbi:Protein cms1 [Paecilomyces lecythidis]
MTEQNPASALSAKVDKKRKRHAEEQSSKGDKANGATTTAGNTPSDGSNKKQKKNKEKYNKNKGKKDKSEQKDKQDKPEKSAEPPKEREGKDGINESIRMMDGALLADHFAQRTKKFHKEMTAVELNDLHIPEQAFLDTTSFESRKLESLPDFLKAFKGKDEDLATASEENGSPHTLVVAAAGLRAADLVRALRPFQKKECMVGKLFAKHIKLEEAKQFCERARMGFGVGTPVRLVDLIDSGALKLTEVKRIVIDASHIDQKQRGIFDMKEIYLPLLKLLTKPELRERYGTKKGRIQILAF